MKRFRFNLEKLLELRKYDEQKWELKLGEIVSKCNKSEHRIRELKGRKNSAFFKYQLDSHGIDELQISELFMKRLESEIDSSSLKLKGYNAERKKIQDKFVEVTNKRKILDKLKEKEEAVYYREQERVEIKEIDDISIGIALRNRKKFGTA